jgi:hypothetical protein
MFPFPIAGRSEERKSYDQISQVIPCDEKPFEWEAQCDEKPFELETPVE